MPKATAATRAMTTTVVALVAALMFVKARPVLKSEEKDEDLIFAIQNYYILEAIRTFEM